MAPLKKRYKKGRGGEKTVEYEIKLLKNSLPLSDAKKETLTKESGQDNHIQATYFHMRCVLMAWKKELLFDSLAKPDPKSAPQIIATRIFEFVERSCKLDAFKKRMKKMFD